MNPPLDPSKSLPTSRLLIETGEQQGMVFPLRESIVSIGRGPDNTIQIIDTRMSRAHTLIIRNGELWYVRDLGSKNGTLLNEKQVGADEQLRHGDRLQVGDTTFLFETEVPTKRKGSTTTGVRVLADDGAIQPSKTMHVYRADATVAGAAPGSRAVPTNDTERLAALYQVADMISSIFDMDELLERALDLVQQFLTPDRVAILLYDEQFNILVPKISRRFMSAKEDLIISTTIIQKAVGEHLAVLVSDARQDFRFKAADSIILQRIHSAICAPFLSKNGVLGVLYMDRRGTMANYDENDLKLAAGIANHSALAIANLRLHNRLVERYSEEREIEIARSIQQNLLPSEMPDLPGFQIRGLSRPARMVGGDYYDVIALSDGRYVLVVANVSGKGVPAAILLAGVRAAVQIEVRNLHRETLLDVMIRLNEMVCRDTTSNMFVTMLMGVLDLKTRTFTYCNAGHVHPMIGLPDGRIQTLETGGCFLGLMPETAYSTETVDLPPGSIMLIYTDGVIDLMNQRQDMFGLQRLVDYVGSSLGLSAPHFCQKLEDLTTAFREGAEPFDDYTVLALKSVEEILSEEFDVV